MSNPDLERNRPRFPRIIAAGADYNHLVSIVQRCEGGEDWSKLWEEFGGMIELLGDEALREGGMVTAGELFAKAAVYFHTAQMTKHRDLPEKERLQRRQQDVYRKAMPYLQPPVQPLVIPYKGSSFPGYLRLPLNARGPVPCVLMLAGLDSTKEELSGTEKIFLDRGMATCTFDGPGQSLTRIEFPLVANIEWSVSAVVDYLEKRKDLDASRFGVWGRSVGGHMAPRAAALEPRLKACVSLGGFFNSPWERFKEGSRQEFAMVTHAKSLDEAGKIAKNFTLDGLLHKLKVPLLVVHSQGDTVTSYHEAEQIAREAGGPVRLVLYPEGNHVCDNVAYKARPLMADWMALRTAAEAVLAFEQAEAAAAIV
ncbi:MAG: alpha/beta hydrolase, partial [Burkholderiales bacterium]